MGLGEGKERKYQVPTWPGEGQNKQADLMPEGVHLGEKEKEINWFSMSREMSTRTCYHQCIN